MDYLPGEIAAAAPASIHSKCFRTNESNLSFLKRIKAANMAAIFSVTHTHATALFFHSAIALNALSMQLTGRTI